MKSNIKSCIINPRRPSQNICNNSSQQQCWVDKFFDHELPHHKKDENNASEKYVIDATDTSIIDVHYPVLVALTQALEVTPISMSIFNDSNLQTPDQENYNNDPDEN